MDKGLTVPKWVLIVRPTIVPKMPQNLSAQAQKFWISMKKRFHWMLSMIRGTDYGHPMKEDMNQRNLKTLADVADKICFGRTKRFGIGS